MTYTYEETIELLQRAVTEKGDGHTAAAAYRLTDFKDLNDAGYPGVTMQPICIVGHALSYVGLLSQVLDTYTIDRQRPALMDQFTPAALQALKAAQLVQDCLDNPGTWGEALIAAKGIEL